MPNISNLETALQDVVVLFHAGGFSHGSGDIAMYGPDYLLDHDVVMVTCNYRLGALGKTIIIYHTNRHNTLINKKTQGFAKT
jgi:carboxylesterase type B